MNTYNIEKSLVLVKKEKKLPNGHYTGKISGYVITTTCNGETYELHCNYGVRGINIPISFKINGDTIEIL